MILPRRRLETNGRGSVSEKKGWGSTVLGWFVVQDEAAGADSGGTGEVGGVVSTSNGA